MNLASWFALLGFIPVSLLIYRTFPPRKAFLWVIFGGFLFLPVTASIEVPIFTDYSKPSAPAYVALLGTLIFHHHLLFSFRPKWFDIPMVVWLVWQFPPSVANGHGLYDGLYQSLHFLVVWVVTYFLARCYFTRPEHLREVVVAVVASGLIYVPLCLFELKMSPCLHLWIYGRYPSPFFDMVRLGGYRPVVFLQHGLMLGFFMCAAAFLSGWLWWFRREAKLQKIGRVSIGWAAGLLIPMALLTRSSGALMIFSFLFGLVLLSGGGKWKWVLVVAVVMAPAYMAARLTEMTNGRFMIDITNALISSEHGREGSLIARLAQEDHEIILIRQKPITGWSNWCPGQDQLWLLLARNTGLPTIGAWLLTFSLPLMLVLASDLRRRRDLLVFGVPLGLVLSGWVMDGLFNGMLNPMWLVSAAALMTSATSTQGPQEEESIVFLV